VKYVQIGKVAKCSGVFSPLSHEERMVAKRAWNIRGYWFLAPEPLLAIFFGVVGVGLSILSPLSSETP